MKRFLQNFWPWIVLIHAGLFLIFWLTNSLFYSQTNDYLLNKIGSRLDYIRICLWIAGGVALWSLARLALVRRGKPHRLELAASILYGLVALVFLLFFYGSFWMLFRESPSQLPRIGQFIQYHRLIMDILILTIIVLLSALWLRRFLNRHPAPGWSEYLRYAAIPFGLLVLIWILALAFPPGSVYQGGLPPKPLLIAHRGASSIAPENTLAAAELAAGLPVYGVETDVHISLDGIPFLMHDDTLLRTTDVKAIYPGREKERAEQFTLAEVRQLNAGNWFLQADPFGTIAARFVSGDQTQLYQSLVVPTLAEELELVRKNQLIFIFDLFQPPEGHPYHEQYFDLVFKQVQAAGIDSQIWWIADDQQASLIRTLAPQMNLIHKPDFKRPTLAADVVAKGYRIINADFGLSPEWIHNYQNAGLWVNLYTVEEPWQYSRFWLQGVESITSSNSAALVDLDAPVLGLSYTTYLAVWSLLGFLALWVLFLLTRPN